MPCHVMKRAICYLAFAKYYSLTSAGRVIHGNLSKTSGTIKAEEKRHRNETL